MSLDYKIATYETLVDLLGAFAERGSPEAVLALIEEITTFVEVRHAGTFADGRLENPAYAIGRALVASGRREPSAPADARRGARRRVLHVGTDLPDIGGHTRIATNWIRNDRGSVHAIAMTGTTLSAPMADAAAASGGAVTFLHGTPQEQALELRALARAAADVVVLHVSNRDAVPVMAFADDDLPPVAVLNHSDHLFWLGSSVADTVVNLRSVGRTLSRERRLSRRDSLMAIPLADLLEGMSRASARQALGIPESQLMLVSVGRGIKYKPDETHDFFRVARTLLDGHREAHLYVVGVTAADASRYSAFGSHERMHLLGPRPDATMYQAAADVYIESFPFGSQTACLEACMCGVPPVLSHTPASLLLTTSEDCLAGVVENPASEAEHIAAASRLMESASARRELGAEVRRRMLAHHVGDGWLAGLDTVYTELAGLSHVHAPLAAEPCRREPYDRVLGTWLDAQASSPLLVPDETPSMLRERASELVYDLRNRGAYGDALWMLDAWRRRAGMSLGLALTAGKLGPHWLASMAKGSRRPGSGYRDS